MGTDPKLRLFYLAKILYEQTDEDHFLTTAQLVQLLEEQTELKVHRQTVKADIELLRSFGFEIEEVKSTQNRYNICGRRFETPELKLLIDAVESSKFITAKKSQELVDKLVSLASRHTAELLKKDINCEGRIKPDNEKVYFIVDTINDAINANKKISFQYFQYTVSKEKKLKNNGDPYVITPLHLVWNGDCYYMIGVYDYKQRLGSFRVDRIAKCPTLLDEPGTPAPEGFDIDEYINTTLRMFTRPIYSPPCERACKRSQFSWHNTQHTILSSNVFDKLENGKSVCDWMIDAVNGNVDTYGLHWIGME